MKKLSSALLDNPIQLAIGVGIVAAVVYFLGKAVVKQVAGVAGGIVSGNNALTAGTPYGGEGVAGTVAAAADSAAGGALSSIGESLGGWLYDAFHTDYDPNTGLQTGAKTVADGVKATDSTWGPIGKVTLRAV